MRCLVLIKMAIILAISIGACNDGPEKAELPVRTPAAAVKESPPKTPTEVVKREPPAKKTNLQIDAELQKSRDRASSDDAASFKEASFHAIARAAVIQNIEPNKLRVGGREFRVKRNPSPLGGAFVYDPRDVFYGVTRNLVWWVPSEDDAHRAVAYPLNSPSKMVTPGLKFSHQAGLLEAPITMHVIDYIFRGKKEPLTTEK